MLGLIRYKLHKPESSLQSMTHYLLDDVQDGLDMECRNMGRKPSAYRLTCVAMMSKNGFEVSRMSARMLITEESLG